MKKLNKEAAVDWTAFIVIVLILAIVIGFILVNSDAFGKGKEFASSCRPVPFFEYKCANEISKGQTACPKEGWTVDNSKECDKVAGKEVKCCYRPQ